MLALIPLFPFLGFLINGCWYGLFQTRPGAHKSGSALPGWIATVAIGSSFVVSLLVFIQLYGMPAESRVIEQTVFHWITIGNALNIDAAFRVDSLSTLFTLVITGVGTLIHLYSIGYMSHDEAPGKFFAYLNLFCFAMLLLVLGANLPVMFLGWEGVGLCSYLLIGFWYTDMDKAKAGKKAFVVNRVGDFGFLLGVFLIFTTFGTLDFHALQVTVGHGANVDPTIITLICLFLFVGCMGKSAQIPLYVWLPDAMAGPTPVSALIHAATMVTSGIYMLARLNFLYVLSPTALNVVATIGVLTAFFAATIAIVQTDIKKILAYSTVSQLGYMFLACGVGAFSAGVFHVITHAFFKALMFLGAGSVIHGMHEEQDVLKMGGLRTRMPITFATFLMGWLAICGVFPFSGFFSKDEILWSAFSSEHGSVLFWALGAVTAVLTAFYMTRLFSLTFLGSPRFTEAKHEAKHETKHSDHHAHGGGDHSIHVHESPLTMTVPLMILAVLSLVGGWIGWPHSSWIAEWLSPVIPAHEALAEGVSASTEYVLMGVSTIGAVLGILFSSSLYKNLARPEGMARKFSGLHSLLEHKWYIDEIYEAAFVRPIQALSQALWKGVDVGVIDWVVLGFGRVSMFTGQAVRIVQTGSVQLYAMMILAGIVVAVGYLVYGMA